MATASGGLTLLFSTQAYSDTVEPDPASTTTETFYTCPAGSFAQIFFTLVTPDIQTGGTVRILIDDKVIFSSSTSGTLSLLDGTLPSTGPYHLSSGQTFKLRAISGGAGGTSIDCQYAIYEYAAP